MLPTEHPSGNLPSSNIYALFGPERTRWTQESLTALRDDLQQKTRLKFLSQTLAQLPQFWKTAQRHYEPFRDFGYESLRQVSKYIAGETIARPQSLSNIQLAPLTIVAHVVDLVQSLEEVDAGLSPEVVSRFNAAQGFCIGFLSAAAISSSSHWAEIEHYVSNAIRLAACIGAVIDIENTLHDSPDRASAFSVRYKTHSDRVYLDATFALYPNAYVSCITDEKTLTITVPASDVDPLCSRLNKANIAITPIGLHGCFHHARHAQAAQDLEHLCSKIVDLQLPSAEKLRSPLISTADAEIILMGALHNYALDLILCKQAQWHQTVKAAKAASPNGREIILFPLGKESFVPRSLLSDNVESTNTILEQPRAAGKHSTPQTSSYEFDEREEIAIVGMACRFPEADTIAEFWDLISSGRISIGKIPVERFNPASISREPKLEDMKGNFLRTPDIFDHRFFGISSREANSMDPQQRLALQVAYEALESTGYFSSPKKDQTMDTGCYLGVGSVDYDANVASENASAFSAPGTLRAFISGRISHFFGWSGPSITFDTACSSSAVAIHTACKALLADECSMALAGGVNVITSPDLYQNLSAASFLTPNGPSRAFDTDANGYCRGEGAGLVVLKLLSKAVADGDHILGVIAGSAVNQGSNCSPITVPASESQTRLYEKALAVSRIGPKEVTYVEAHGTGTPVGDPIEYESVRSAFTSIGRDEQLFIGAVKDNIGHTEAASGAAGLLKSLLMIQHKVIPKQANFVTLNPKIKPSAADRISIPQETQPWTVQRRVALVNNYGAAGSNAAIILREYEDSAIERPRPGGLCYNSTPKAYPIILCARSQDSLNLYMTALRSYLQRTGKDLSTIAYNIARRQNPSFGNRVSFAVSDLEDLISRLNRSAAELAVDVNRHERSGSPVVLCFGGQTSQSVGLSQELYEDSKLLRTYLNECDATCQALELPSLFPGIFQDDPVEHTVSLHCRLFSLQYSSAKCWLDCGLEVDTVLGHSFGQFTALCIAESISLKDALRLVSERARLMHGIDPAKRGAMLSVEGDKEYVEIMVKDLNANSSLRLDFACYNGPRSFVLAGDLSSIERLEEACRSADLPARYKVARLRTSHAYHSHLLDSILPGLAKVMKSVEIKQPRIRIETCSQSRSWEKFTAEEVVQHTRKPVFFSEAVERIAARLPSAVWLEAGSASPVIAMTRRVLASNIKPEHVFVPIDLGASHATRNLVDAMCQLWSAGSGCQHWPFHRSQRGEYDYLNLPPYQFENARHWLEYRPRHEMKSGSQPQSSDLKRSDLVTLGRDDASGDLHFSVNTSNAVFDLAARGHAVAGHGLCPASMYIELALQCAGIITGDMSERLPLVEELIMLAPLGLSGTISVSLRFRNIAAETWKFAVLSESMESGSEVQHANGRISLTPATDQNSQSRMKLLRRMARGASSDKWTDVSLAKGVSGPMVYKIFNDVVEYADYYHGVERVTGLDNEAIGVVATNHPSNIDPGLCNPIALDNFLQVAGIHVNCLSNRKSDEVFMCTAVEEIVFTKVYIHDNTACRSWTVYSRYVTTSKVNIINDIFVHDTESKDLVLVILGASFRSVPFRSVANNLANIKSVKTAGLSRINPSSTSSSSPERALSTNTSPSSQSSEDIVPTQKESEAQGGDVLLSAGNTIQRIIEMLSTILGIPVDEIRPASTFDALGVDSLLVTEVLAEIQKIFSISITPADFQKCDDVQSLHKRLQLERAGEMNQNPSDGAKREQKEINPTQTLASKFRDVTGSDGEACTLGDLAVTSHMSFERTKPQYGQHSERTGFKDFCTEVHPLQSELVVQYVVEAFSILGYELRHMTVGDEVPVIKHIPQHGKLVSQLYKILRAADIITNRNGTSIRTATSVPASSAATLHSSMLEKYPKHTSETKLLHTTAHRLADCLSGTADPIALIFRDAAARTLLEDVYTNAPMFKTGTLCLAEYLSHIVESYGGSREIRILELGAGTGGTTKLLLEKLASSTRKFSYTFTDLSSSLVGAAKHRFAKYPFMHYAVLDVEKETEQDHVSAFDIVVSTNCVHATKNLVVSTSNIRKMLRPDGVLCLVELTRNLFWFDLVFGLLEGWWLFNDGREHALADETRWKQCLNAAGFQWVDWTEDSSRESGILRVITASPFEVATSAGFKVTDDNVSSDTLQVQETVAFKDCDGLSLSADIYYPSHVIDPGESLSVALMIHGGGHIMLSRKDVRPHQTNLLLRNGFLPISIDYRLCPEIPLPEGPMADVADALAWIRNSLPRLPLKRNDVRVNGEKVVAIGWSTGGHLAMSLAWTSISLGIRPPEAILVFYCPTDYEDPFWLRPNIPAGSKADVSDHLTDGVDNDKISAGLYNSAITSYNVPKSKHPVGGWLAPNDARSRIALYMNWHGRTLHVLLNGLDKSNYKEPLAPTVEQIAAVSPLAKIRCHAYKTPTFIIHSRQDDLIPCEQAERTFEALRSSKVDAELRIVEDAPHLFDIYPSHADSQSAAKAIREGYDFLCQYVS